MTKFQYLWTVTLWVKMLQLESEGFWFKPQLTLSWDFYDYYLAVPQPTLNHSQKDSLPNPIGQNRSNALINIGLVGHG